MDSTNLRPPAKRISLVVGYPTSEATDRFSAIPVRENLANHEVREESSCEAKVRLIERPQAVMLQSIRMNLGVIRDPRRVGEGGYEDAPPSVTRAQFGVSTREGWER